jgi:hypothetical protein
MNIAPTSEMPSQSRSLRIFVRVSREDKLSLTVIFLLSLAVMLPIFVKGFPKGDDAEIHYRWASEFRGELSDGVVYPRWLSEANYGQGSPAMLFYPPLPFYVVAACSLVSANLLQALAWASWLALLLSGLAMYRLGRRFFSPSVSLCAAGLYLLLPYHISDLYERSALSEFWAFAWIPLLMDALLVVACEKASRKIFYLAFTYALLLLTHVPMSLAFSLLIPGIVLFVTRDLGQLFRVAKGLLLGIGLSAIFLLPVLFESRYINIRIVLGADYKAIFLFRDLANTFSGLPFQARPNEEAITLAYWDCNWIAFALLFLFAVTGFVLWKERRKPACGFLHTGNGKAILFVAAFSFFLMTRYSKFLWKVIFALPYLQFPFRWLALASAGTALLSGAALKAFQPITGARSLAIALFALAIACNLGLTALSIVRANFGLNSTYATGEVAEYQPIWSAVEGKPRDFKRAAAIVESGDATVNALDETGTLQSYEINARTEATVKFRTLYFPGWTARLNRQLTDVRPNALGNIEIQVPAGDHHLLLTFEDTWPRKAGKWISLVSLFLMLTLPFVVRRTSRIAVES